MKRLIVTAVFDANRRAARAVDELRDAGVPDRAISVLVRKDGETVRENGSDSAKGLVKGVAYGAGAGALFGMAALAIPGVGPFIAAGAIAEAAIGGAALTGAAVGAAAVGLISALTEYGLSDEDARYYEERIEKGGVFIAVDVEEAGLSGLRLQLYSTPAAVTAPAAWKLHRQSRPSDAFPSNAGCLLVPRAPANEAGRWPACLPPRSRERPLLLPPGLRPPSANVSPSPIARRSAG